MKYFKGIFLIIFLFILSSCSYQTIKLDRNNKNLLQGKSIAYVKKSKPNKPKVYTFASALSDAIINTATGSSLMTFDYADVNGINNPANITSDKIGQLLSNRYGMNYIGTNVDSADYLIDVKSFWIVHYYGLHWGSYRVTLNNDIKVYNKQTNKTLFQISCNYDPDYTEDAPSYKEMFENNGMLLKELTNKAIDLCLQKVKSQAL